MYEATWLNQKHADALQTLKKFFGETERVGTYFEFDAFDGLLVFASPRSWDERLNLKHQAALTTITKWLGVSNIVVEFENQCLSFDYLIPKRW